MTETLTRRAVGEVWEQPIADILAGWTSGDGGRPGGWDQLLEDKRGDWHYSDVVESIRERGFVRPLTCRYASEESAELQFGDGHHRLAAAIDLGLSTVPMELGKGWVISGDSGCWDASQSIPERNFRR